MPGWLVPLLIAVFLGLTGGTVGARLLMGTEDGNPAADTLRPRDEAMRLLSLLRRSVDDGLDPQRYSVAQIERDLARADDPAALARADRLLAEALAAYGRDLRVPRRARITYVDPELAPQPPGRAGDFTSGGGAAERLAQVQSRNPVYQDLRAAFARYRARWSGLPQVRVPPGEALGPGGEGERVETLRRRLGLGAAGGYDGQLAEAVRAFRAAHGLAPSPIADHDTIAALNRGAAHYERLIALNLDRARALPVDGRRYVLVDTAGARLSMIEGGREVDSMRAIIGQPTMATPELAGLIRFAVVNPYWNIPPDLVQQTVAPQVVRAGPSYLAARRYVLFSDWRETAVTLEPQQVDWAGVASGSQKVWVRQLPGGDNMLGMVKFMLPNRMGIYLHDTPRRADFEREDRRISSGCVRVEDARRLARWLFGDDPLARADGTPEQRIDLPQPVPVYILHLTVIAEGGEVRFQKDHYGRDAALLGPVGNPA